MWIMEQVGEQRSTVSIHNNSDCLLKSTPTKHYKYEVYQKRKYFHDISFRELFGRIRMLDKRIIKSWAGASWSWSNGSWIYNYLCNHFLSPLKLWIRTRPCRGVFDTTLCDKVCERLATGRWFTPGTLLAASV